MRGEVVFVLVALLLAGCSTPTDTVSDAPATPSSSGAPSGPRAEEGSAGGSDGGVAAPELAVGRAWTYEGYELYNGDASFTVVVAQAEAEGYLFAGGAEDDLVYDALWASPWFGPRDRSLNSARYDLPLLRFPLREGDSWSYSSDITLRARAASIDTPLGKDDGFVIEGASERVVIRAEYSPRAQNVVRFHTTIGGKVFQDIRMTAVADGQPWVWYQLGTLGVASNPHEPAAIDVSDGFDHVIASAGGTTGGRAHVAGPGGPAWEVEFSGDESWTHAMLDATPGDWVGIVAGRPYVGAAPDLPAEPPVGWAYMHVAPVRWTYGAP